MRYTGFIRVTAGTAMRALLCAALAGAAHADVAYSSEAQWGYYLRHCEQLVDKKAQVQRQIDERSDQVFSTGISFDLDGMAAALKHTAAEHRIADKVAECQALAAAAKGVLAKAEAYVVQREKGREAEARAQHNAAPEMRYARALGFASHSVLATLKHDYQTLGAAKLKRIMLLVDDDCGAHFRAVQRVSGYVIYAPGRNRNSACGGDERVAVQLAPGVTAQSGSYIDADFYYVFERLLDAKTLNGFPTQVPLLRQVRPPKRPVNAAIK